MMTLITFRNIISHLRIVYDYKLTKYYGEIARWMDKDSFNKKLGEYVRLKRKEIGWTQEELGNKTGIDRQNINRLEKGSISPTLFWFTRITKAFNKDLSGFLKDFDYSDVE